MNVGWYVVYLLMICINSVVTAINGFNIATWQFWVQSGLLIMCFVSGANCYR